MTPIPGAPAPGTDDLEARLAAALKPELTHLVADAAALRAHARVGSRRIRRRRRVAAGALTVVVLGGIGALALPRSQAPSPVPLPVATPTVTPTGVTSMPSPTETPTGTPSLAVTSTPPTGSASRTHTPSGSASGTRTTMTTSAPAAAGSPSGTATSSRPATTGPVQIGDWMSVAADTGYVPDETGSLYESGGEVTIIIPIYQTQWCQGVPADGFVAGRFWEFDPASSGYSKQSVTVWEKGKGRLALSRMPACYGASGLIQRTSDRFIKALTKQVGSDVVVTEIRAFGVVDDVLVGVALNRSDNVTVDQAAAYANGILDRVFARMKANGLG